MAYIDTVRLDQKPLSPLAWEALMAHIDQARLEPLRQKTAPVGASLHVRQVQQMLLAATMAAGAILAVAGVMLLRLL